MIVACSSRRFAEKWPAVFLGAWLGIMLAASLRAETTTPALGTLHTDTEATSGTPRVKEVSPGIYQVGGVVLDAHSRQIRFPARVNMNRGLIEVVICTESGKKHESILCTTIRPMDLHTALLLLGLRPGRNPAWPPPPMDASGKPAYGMMAPGDRLEVSISWKEKGKPRELRADQLLMDIRTSQTLPRTDWVFTGSVLNSAGKYLADGIGSLVTNYHDASSVIDCPLSLGAADDFTYANEGIIPDVGTIVEVRMAPVKKNKTPVGKETRDADHEEQ